MLQTNAYAAWVFSNGYYWESYGGKYYALTQTGNAATWDQVRQEALDLGGDLVVINDAGENNFLASTMFASPHYQDLPGFNTIPHLWIGLCQTPGSAEPDGGWNWVDGSPLTYTNWAYGTPSNGRQVEDWGAITLNMDNLFGSWNDYHPFVWLEDFGYDGIQGIMEFDALPTVAPAPGAALLTAIGSACVGWLRRRAVR